MNEYWRSRDVPYNWVWLKLSMEASVSTSGGILDRLEMSLHFKLAK